MFHSPKKMDSWQEKCTAIVCHSLETKKTVAESQGLSNTIKKCNSIF